MRPVEEARAGKERKVSEPRSAREERKQPDPGEDSRKASDEPHCPLTATVVRTEDGLHRLGRAGDRCSLAVDGRDA
jgi:hypothetical protein